MLVLESYQNEEIEGEFDPLANAQEIGDEAACNYVKVRRGEGAETERNTF